MWKFNVIKLYMPTNQLVLFIIISLSFSRKFEGITLCDYIYHIQLIQANQASFMKLQRHVHVSGMSCNEWDSATHIDRTKIKEEIFAIHRYKFKVGFLGSLMFFNKYTYRLDNFTVLDSQISSRQNHVILQNSEGLFRIPIPPKFLLHYCLHILDFDLFSKDPFPLRYMLHNHYLMI